MRAPLLYLLLLALPTLAAAAAPLQVTAVPRRVVLGRDPVVVVRVAVPSDSPPLRATASTGQLMPLDSSRPGEAAYSWTPPDIRYPLLAVLAFWVDRPGAPPEVTPLYIPLLGRITLNVDTQGGPGTQVVVQVADTSFGPLPTNRRGRAQVPVEVPPGVHEARVLATSKRQKLRRTIPLDVPPEQPLIAVLSPSPLPQEEEGWLVTLGSEPVPGSALRLRVRGASTEEQAPGVFRVKPEPSASAVVVEAKRTDGTATAHASIEVVHASVVAPEPPPPLVVPLAWELPPPARVSPPPRPPPASRGLSLSTHVLAGVFLAGGDNRGPQVSLGVGARMPGLGGRLSLEAEAGVRQSASHPTVEPLGSLDAQIVALPVLLSARVRAFERGRLSLQGRVGGGAVYYTHRATSSFFDTPLVQRGWTSMGFVAVQAAWRLGMVSPLLELHGAYSLANTRLVDARFGGLSMSVGLRYSR